MSLIDSLCKMPTNLYYKVFRRRQCRVVMLGLENSGKTAILFRMKTGEVVSTTSTSTFNVETIDYKNISFTIWDIGTRTSVKPGPWRHYLANTDAVVYVIDSSTPEQIPVAREELKWILSNEALEGVPVLVLCNKQDLPNAMSESEIAPQMEPSFHGSTRRRHLQKCSATSGEGFNEGFDWLTEQLNAKN